MLNINSTHRVRTHCDRNEIFILKISRPEYYPNASESTNCNRSCLLITMQLSLTRFRSITMYGATANKYR